MKSFHCLDFFIFFFQLFIGDTKKHTIIWTWRSHYIRQKKINLQNPDFQHPVGEDIRGQNKKVPPLNVHPDEVWMGTGAGRGPGQLPPPALPLISCPSVHLGYYQEWRTGVGHTLSSSLLPDVGDRDLLLSVVCLLRGLWSFVTRTGAGCLVGRCLGPLQCAWWHGVVASP